MHTGQERRQLVSKHRVNCNKSTQLTYLLSRCPVITGNLPHLSFIQRKPEPLGTEFKVAACGRTGIFLHLELQRGKAAMADAEYANIMLKTAACASRLIKNTRNCGRNGEDEEERKMSAQRDTYLGDAWFGSVDAVLAAASHDTNLVCVIKNAHNRYPKKYIEKTMQDWPPGSNLVLQATIRGVDMVAVGYKYSKRKVLTFLCNKEAADLQPGTPYLAKWKDEHGNSVSRFVPRPAVIANYFRDSNRIDAHNQSRQFDLRLEKCWVTRCGFFCINTSLLGMTIVDAWKAYCHHINTRHRHHNICLTDFVSVLTKDLLENHLSRDALVPPPSFNLAGERNRRAEDENQIVGSLIQVPGFEMDPVIPQFERLTQDSIYPIPGEDPEVDDALDSIMPERSVERGEHGLKKIDEWVVETITEKDERGRMLMKNQKRRERGVCNYCQKKTSYFCPACTPGDKASKFWCCGPDVRDGRQCQALHDSKWIFGGDGGEK